MEEKGRTHTCHFKHEGLKLGRPFDASWSDMKTYRVGRSRNLGERVGSSFGGYVRRGNLLKRRARGAGILNQPVDSGLCFDFVGVCRGSLEVFFWRVIASSDDLDMLVKSWRRGAGCCAGSGGIG